MSRLVTRAAAAQCPAHGGCALDGIRGVDTLTGMSDALRFTIRYSDGGEGWIMAQVEEVAGAISQGRTRHEARENVTDALRLMLKPEPDETSDPDREPLEPPLTS